MAPGAALDILLYISLHAWPVRARTQDSQGFIDPLVTMSIMACLQEGSAESLRNYQLSECLKPVIYEISLQPAFGVQQLSVVLTHQRFLAGAISPRDLRPPAFP